MINKFLTWLAALWSGWVLYSKKVSDDELKATKRNHRAIDEARRAGDDKLLERMRDAAKKRGQRV
jgi:hypothetical protein